MTILGFMSKPDTRTILRILFGRYIVSQGHMGYIDGYTNIVLPKSRSSIEHVVPRCHLPKSRVWDLNNLLIVDKAINNHRSNTKFGERTIRGITYCPPKNKGMVSRICAHMIEECERMKHDVESGLIIDPDLMVKWHEENPVTDHERYLNECVFEIQGTYNTFVDGKHMS